MIRRGFVCALLFFLAAGCTTTIIPPKNVSDPATIYVTNYGKHSSLLLPESNDRHYVEYAFGDWDYFAAGHKDSSTSLHALFFSRDSTLGRREISLPDVPDQDLIPVINSKQVESLAVSRDRSDKLREQLDAIYHAHIDSKVFNEKAKLWLVKYNGGYGACHNCNHVTADWLRELGCTIRGSAMFSKFRVKPT